VRVFLCSSSSPNIHQDLIIVKFKRFSRRVRRWIEGDNVRGSFGIKFSGGSKKWDFFKVQFRGFRNWEFNCFVLQNWPQLRCWRLLIVLDQGTHNGKHSGSLRRRFGLRSLSKITTRVWVSVQD
jgi:hypothetical protein